MEEDNKYYIPDPSELFIGYIGEVGVAPMYDGDPGGPSMEKELTASDIVGIDDGDLYIQTRYLNRQDIESCGWVYKSSCENLKDNSQIKFFHLNRGTILKDTQENRWELRVENSYRIRITQGYEWMRFLGQCKSINELRKIMQLIGIK